MNLFLRGKLNVKTIQEASSFDYSHTSYKKRWYFLSSEQHDKAHPNFCRSQFWWSREHLGFFSVSWSIHKQVKWHLLRPQLSIHPHRNSCSSLIAHLPCCFLLYQYLPILRHYGMQPSTSLEFQSSLLECSATL